MKREVSTLEQKIQWLLEHRHFLIGKADERKIILAMKHDGLIAKSTYWPDVKVVDEALRQAKFKWYAEHNGRGIKP